MTEEEESSSSPEELRYVLPQNSIVLDNSIVPWEQATLNPSRLIRNMTNNLKTHRYQEEENEKYVKKDIILLASAWCCLCKNDSVEFVCSVMPLIETNDKIQKRFNSVAKRQGLYWSNKNNDLIESCNALVSGYHINNSNLDKEKKPVRDFLQEGEKFCNSIKKLLPKFDGKLVLDVPRCKSDIWVENQPQSQHLHNQSGIRNILHSILIRVMSIRTHHSQDEYVTDCNKILALYPIQVATNKTEDNGVPDLAAVLYQIFTTSKGSSLFCNMAEVLYNTSSEYMTISILCGCAAAMRLHDNVHGGRADMFSQLIPMILCKVVEDKITPKTHRPFFSTNKLRRLENQLGIGMHSKANYACNECGVSGSRCNDTNDTNGNEKNETGITLRKCNGWYV